eukprot:GFYU01006568.1.p1 GENE.GFYU01006568.1~~GFYU01006568.1.p1  ORF type:complete len:312 (-),score=83.57 GFYU01006568.1:129-1010(-)
MGEEKKDTAVVRGLKDFAAGTVGGVAQVLVGHPFMTVKVRLQTQPSPPIYKGGMDCVRQIVAKEGATGLYKGMGSPLVGIGLVNAVLFYANEAAKRALQSDPDTPLGPLGLATAGGLAGIITATVSSPVELIMVRLQTQYILSDKQLYSGPIDCARQIVKQNGVLGLYNGFASTVIREIPNYAAYFFGYEITKRHMQMRVGDDLGPLHLFLAGGIAGICAQVSQLPFDTVKSRLQTQSEVNPIYKGTIDCFRQTMKADGIAGFYKGLGPTLARAFPANAATFLAFEMAMKFLA